MKLRAIFATALSVVCLASWTYAQQPGAFGYSAGRPAPAAPKKQEARLIPANSPEARLASRPRTSSAPVARVAQTPQHPAASPAPAPHHTMQHQPVPQHHPMPQHQPVPDGNFGGGFMPSDGPGVPCTHAFGGDYTGPAHGGMTHPFRHCLCCKGTGDLPQHFPYCAEGKGYYYFRPYHVMHIFAQQEMVTRWGGDPRHPYENSIFQRIDERFQQQQLHQTPYYSPQAPIQPEYVIPQGPYPAY